MLYEVITVDGVDEPLLDVDLGGEVAELLGDALGPCVASLADEGEAIVAALDEVFSRAWG